MSPQRPHWMASRIVAVFLLVLALWAGPGIAGVAGRTPNVDVRGRWDLEYTFRPPGKVIVAPATMTITRQDPRSGAIRGRFVQPETPFGNSFLEASDEPVAGQVTGRRLVLRSPGDDRNVYDVQLVVRKGQLTFDSKVIPGVTLHAVLVRPLVRKSPEGGDRVSGTVPRCDVDLAASTGDALVLTCVAIVTDASEDGDGGMPSGTVDWTTSVGRMEPSSCQLGGSGACLVSWSAGSGQLAVGSRPVIEAAYVGDAEFGPSEGSTGIAVAGLDASDTLGPTCNPATTPKPNVDCGDPVNPATGNLSMSAVDLSVGGRGPGIAVSRTYNALAASSGDPGRFGAGWSDPYGAHVRIGPGPRVTVVLGTGATVPFTVKGRAFTAPGWVTATLTRNAAKGYVLTFLDRGVLTFDAEGRLVTIADRTNAPVSLGYAADGTLAAVTDAAGRAIRFTADAAGRVVTAVDPAGRTVSYAYDPAGDLVAVTDVAGGVTAYGYNDQHRMTSVTDQRGSRATTAYDPQDRVIRQVDPLGGILSFEYRGAFPDVVTIATDGNGVRSGYAYQGGVLVSTTAALGTQVAETTRFVYDDDLALVATLDPGGNVWRFARDAAGDIVASTDPLGRTTSMTWSKRHDLTSVTSPMGRVSTWRYDKRGLVTRMTVAAGTPLEATTLVAHDDPDHPADVTSVTDPVGAVTTFGRDDAGDIVSVTDALGGVTRFERDVLGWVTAVTDPMGGRVTVSRDVRGLATSVTDAMGNTTASTWDAAGALASVTDPLGAVTSLIRDAAGRSTGAVLADGALEGAVRDPLGQVVSQTDAAGATMTRGYDLLGRAVSVAGPGGSMSTAAWDAAGRLTSTTDELGEPTVYAWDAAGQLLAIDHAGDTPDVRYTYDLDGARTSMTDGTGTTTYAYDAAGRLVATTDATAATVRTTYDLRGGTTAIAYPDGLSVDYTLDLLGRPVSVTDSLGHTSTFEYDAVGRLVSSALGDGTVERRTYDANGSLLSITGGPVMDVLTRDALGRVASIAADGGRPRSVSRDVRGRLTAIGEEAMAVDAAGALTSLRGDRLTYDEAGRLLTQAGPAGTTTFTFDAAGRRIAQTGAATTTYGYGAAGRLISAGSSTWAYDGDGVRRSATAADGSTAAFTWLATGVRPVLLSDGASRYVYGPGVAPIAEIAADGTTRWLHADALGSVRAITDAQGSVIGTSSFDAYGLPIERSGSATSPFGFQGAYTDPDSGLQYLLARVYDPATGQFLTVDPAVLTTKQPYAFAASDPVTYADPTGLDVTLAGHGAWHPMDGTTVVPAGTTVVFHGPAGWKITDDLGNAIERTGSSRFEERFGPGSVIPDYILSAPIGLTIEPTSRTVSSDTKLSSMLAPGQGEVHWAACRALRSAIPGYPMGEVRPLGNPGSPYFDRWTADHFYMQKTRASDSGSAWTTDSIPVFGDTQPIEEIHHLGPYKNIADPVDFMPGV